VRFLEPQMVSLGWKILVVVVLGLGLMVYLGWYSYKKRIGVTIKDFFVASKTLGFIILGLALFADAYSGNSFLGYAAKSYRAGAWFLVYPQFMIAALIGALLVAPALINLGKKWGYISPIDFLEHRFNSKLVALLALIFMMWGTFVQFTEQFFAMGYLGEVASGGVVPYQAVIILFALVIFIYVVVGGFRGTALTAAVQGLLMILSLCFMLILIGLLGGLTQSLEVTWQVAPQKLMIPSSKVMITWYSTIILVLLGLPTYIHILQYYLGVKDAENLRRAFRIKAPIFFFAAFTLWLVGMFGTGYFPDLGKVQSDKLVPYLMGALAITHPYGDTIASIIGLGVVMATLSTAAATVMVLSMALAKDLYRRFINPKAPDAKVINASRVIVGLLLALALVIAFKPTLTIWRWTEIKFELLLQATPALIFGLYLPRVKKKPVIAGMIVGGVLAVVLTLAGYSKVYGIHAGIIGFLVNCAIVLVGSYAMGEDDEVKRAREILTYVSIEVTETGEQKYRLPVYSKTFWAGLVLIFAIMVPWYAPESWNVPSAFNIPLWTWVVIVATVIEMLFVIFATYVWHKE